MAAWKSSRAGWGVLLGFALGGFFDGILLHQILQWHHLLSLATPGDLRGQVLWDGLFHASMYLIAIVALWGLWSRRRVPITGPQLIGLLMLGFGVWHLLDAVLSHWLLGIHRIKIDSPSPLAWDIAWMVVFGLAPIGLGMLISRREGSGRKAGLVVVVSPDRRWGFYARGALLVSGSGPGGCLDWSSV